MDRMIEIFSKMNEKSKWTDDRVLMMAASVYVVKNRPFEVDRYIELCDYIKEETGVFSYLKSTMRFTVAAWLDTRFDDPKSAFRKYSEVYETMISKGFKRTPFTYIAALVMLEHHDDLDDWISRALTVYERMKQEHPFITSKDDYPLAVVLSEGEGEIDPLIEGMEEIYSGLHKKGFMVGNNLQFMSHMLSMDKEHSTSDLIDRVVHISDQMKRASLKVKGMHYPDVGLLVLMDDVNRLDDIRTVRDQLNKTSKYRWHRDLNYKLAVQIVLSDSLDQLEMTETSLLTSMEVIMQAQQTTMMAGAIGVAATADGGGA
ncbi:DUF4003 domain-containing protein [Halobacillus litoralis]|uniref:DUF4003 family protein n=1 Tax=Halobacillus litoralis TaxID=45668 RepID=UPI001CD5DBBE|nr:DUF4003 family protein [Halobacillus litoralis]MCA0972410.1 DUF4003 domain-containing protein [Halobacillus litoralis]